MAGFHVRVELHQAGGDDYERLHQSMHEAGFERYVKGDTGWLELPTGTYWYSGAMTDGEAVRAVVKRIANSVKATPDPFVFVTGNGANGENMWWGYLKRAK